MRTTILFISVFFFFLLTACSGAKSTGKTTETGDIIPDTESSATSDSDLGYITATDDTYHKKVDSKDESGEFLTKAGVAQKNGGSDSVNTPDSVSSSDNSSSYNDSDSAATDDSDPSGSDGTREIVEADIYKVEESIVWVLNRFRGLIAVSLENPDKPAILSRISFSGAPKEMFFRDNRAYILVNDLKFDAYNPNYSSYSTSRILSGILVIDTSDKLNLKIMGKFTVEGNIMDSRMVGDVIYITASQNEYYYYNCNNNQKAGYNGISIMSLNVADPNNIVKADEEKLDGFAYAMYVTDHSIYVADADYYKYSYDPEENGRFPVHYFDISDPAGDIVNKGSFKSSVFISDRWKMFEKDGVFFAVGTKNNSWSGDSVVESFDVSDPSAVKKISELTFMQNQQLYGTRYDDNRLYAVTYRRTDPLHVIDITDPAKMKQLGELWIPGWSTFFEIRSGRLLAVGIDDQSGRAAKISLFDVRDPAAPKEVDTVLLTPSGSYGTSEANYDWKAFGVYDDLKMLLVPTTYYDYTNSYGYYHYQLSIVDFDLDKGLELRGSVESPGPVRRGIVFKDQIVSIGDTNVMVIDPADHDNPKVRSSVSIAYNSRSINIIDDRLCGETTSSNGEYYDTDFQGMLSFFNTSPLSSKEQFEAKKSYYYDLWVLYSKTAVYLLDNWRQYNGKEVQIRKVAMTNGVAAVQKTLTLNRNESDEAMTVLEKDQLVSNQYRTIYYCDGNDQTKESMQCAGKDTYAISRARLMGYDLNSSSAKISPQQSDIEVRPLYGISIFKDKTDKIWTTDCKLYGYDAKKVEILKCYAQAFTFSENAKPVAAERYNIPGELVGVNSDATIFYSMKFRETMGEDGKTIVEVPHIYILHLKDKSLNIAGIIPLPDHYTSSPTSTEAMFTQYVINNNSLAVASFYRQQKKESDCTYWQYTDQIKFSAQLTMFDAVTAAPGYSATIDGGFEMYPVNNGGVLFPVTEKSSYRYWNRNFTEGYAYFDPVGNTTQFKIDEATNYARSSNSYYYYNPTPPDQKAAVKNNYIYISGGWLGIIEHKL